MTDDRITAWVAMQKVVWHGDTSSKASLITLKKRGSDDCIFRCPADAENLAEMIKQALRMQADELPKGSHGFVLIASDENGVQLSELPQTVKGCNGEATSAAQEQLALANANAKALGNLDTVNQILQRNAEQLSEKVASSLEDKFAVLDELVRQRGTNFMNELELAKFNRSQARLDTLVQALAPAVTLLSTWAAEKLLAANPNIIGKLGGDNATSPATKEPVDSASPSVAEPRQEAVPPNGQGRGKGNHRPVPAQRR